MSMMISHRDALMLVLEKPEEKWLNGLITVLVRWLGRWTGKRGFSGPNVACSP